MARIWKETLGIQIGLPFPRMPDDEAMAKYGVDKPDLRDVRLRVREAYPDGPTAHPNVSLARPDIPPTRPCVPEIESDAPRNCWDGAAVDADGREPTPEDPDSVRHAATRLLHALGAHRKVAEGRPDAPPAHSHARKVRPGAADGDLGAPSADLRSLSA